MRVNFRSWAKTVAMTAALTAAMLGSLLVAPAVTAQTFPSKPVQLVIPFAPGDTDQMLRPIVDRMGEYLGQPVVLNYKTGAGGGVGAAYVAGSKPDGYTIVGSSPGSLVIVPLANKEFKYTTESFEPIAALSEGGLLLIAPANSPYKTLDDLVKAARDKPGTISFGSSGAMGITHLLAEIFSQSAKIKLTHIPFQGSGLTINALLGGHIDIASSAIAPAQGHIKAGTLRALAVFSDTRLAAYPDVPTLKELGYNVGSPTLYGIVAPKGTPPAAINLMYEAAKKAIEQHHDQIAASLALLGGEIKLLGPQDYTAYLRSQKALFTTGIDAVRE